MANGVDITTTANPWKIVFHLGAGTPLPATVVGKQTNGYAFPVRIKRLVWESATAAQGDTVIVQDINGNDLARFVATGADYMPPQEWKPDNKEGYAPGFVISQFDSGILYVHL